MVTAMIEAIVEAITGLLGGFGTSIVDVFNDLFIVTGEGGATSISNLGLWGLAFLGIGFASSLLYMVINKI